MKEDISKKILSATKWSTLTEIISRLISPISNMVLARMLVPEAFGVVATVTMIMSFADLLTNAGFQKYLVQHEFKNKAEKYNHANVAFLTNIIFSFLLWFIIIIFQNPLATLVGNPGLGYVIAIACIQLPLTAFSSIQMALYRRDFDFKTLFTVKMVGICIPILITIPLAFLGFSYWSLIIGTIMMHVFNAVILTVKSQWKPNRYFSYSDLKEMFSFSIWSLVEAISIWLTLWVDVFIISSFLNQYFLGLYKTSITMVNALMALVTASIIPVLFSALSRNQNNEREFKKIFYKYQKIVAYLILPMGVGVFLFSDLATKVMLGNQWTEASSIIGIWALTSVFVIITSHFNSEVYRAKGRPKLSFISQMISLCFLVPTCLISVKYGFWVLVYARALIRFQSVITGFIIMKFIMNFPIMNTIKNILKPLIFTLLMGVFGSLFKQVSDTTFWSVFTIILCMFIYIGLIFKFASKDLLFAKKFIKFN